jgi:WD40 repeat protein
VIQYDQVSVSADGSLAEVLPYPDRSKLQSAILLRISPNGSPTQAGEFLFDSDKRLEQLSADGHWIVAGRGSSFAIFDSMTQARQGSLGDPYLTAFRQHASIPGANRLLSLATANGSRGTANSTEEILLQELPGGKRLKTVTHPTVMNTLAVSKDGRIFAEAGIDRRIRIRDSETLEIKTEFRAHDAPIRSLAFHPGGRLLASASEDFTVKIWEISTGHMVEELRGFVATPFGLSFSPSGRRLACGTWGQGARLSETHVWELPTIAPEGAAPQ